MSNKFLKRAALSLTALFALAGGLAAAEIFDATKPARPAATFQFDTIRPFLKFADAHGDRNSMGHGSFAQMPGEMASSSHIHSAAYHGVVIQGVMTNGFDGDKNPPRLAAGSYWYVPANAVHITACVSKEPCLFYIHSDDKFDAAPPN